MSSARRLRSSDVWVLMAIWHASSRRAAPLAHVIAAADLINHATPAYEELASGLVRLERAGLIVRPSDALAFRCAPGVRARIGRFAAKASTLFDAWQAVEVALKAEPWIPGEPMPHPANTHSYPSLTEEVFRAALNDHLHPQRRRLAKRATRSS